MKFDYLSLETKFQQTTTLFNNYYTSTYLSYLLLHFKKITKLKVLKSVTFDLKGPLPTIMDKICFILN